MLANLPSNALPLALWLDADRMGFLLPTMDKAKLDLQREVVKNERRQGVDNVPYGRADETILAALYPKGHPYSWSVIGSLADLDAAEVSAKAANVPDGAYEVIVFTPADGVAVTVTAEQASTVYFPPLGSRQPRLTHGVNRGAV